MKKTLLSLLAVAMVAISASATKINVSGNMITGPTSFSVTDEKTGKVGTVTYDNNTPKDVVVYINSSYFPDANFRSYLLELFPSGYITSDDVNSTTTIDVEGKNISNLQGIHYFTAVVSLNCDNNNLTSLPNLSALTKLEWLYCDHNQLTSLPNLSALTQLKSLLCDYNQLNSLPDLSALTKLEWLYCDHNKLTSPPSLPPSLKYLRLRDNRFAEFHMNGHTNLVDLELDDCPNLKTVSVNNNSSLLFLRLSNCSALTTVYCYSDDLSVLALTGCTKLEYLNCEHNRLSVLYLDNNPALKKVYASDNEISYEYLTFGNDNKSNLEILELNSNSLRSFTVQNFTKLTSLGLADNPHLKTVTVTNNNALNRLGLKNCPLLSTLKCNNNNLGSVNFSTTTGGIELYNSTALKDFDCSHNQITSLFEYNISSLLGNLIRFNCSYNQLASLYVAGLSSLETLNCSNNKLNYNGFYSSGGMALYELDCSHNLFSGFDASHLSNLTYLDFSYNQLNNITVSSNSKLQTLKVQYNKLTNLNPPTSIVTLHCDGNSLTGFIFYGRNKLTELSCSLNQIDESHMGSLISTLPTIPEGSQGLLKVIAPGYTNDGVPEANVITDEQVENARNKRWIPMKYVNGSWVVIPVGEAVSGDVNGDGSCTSSDVTALYNYLLYNDDSAIVNGDQNGDGAITSSDVTAVYNIILFSGGTSQSDVTEFTVNGVTFKMVAVEGGTFTMGATAEQSDDAYDDEKPTHQVTLSTFSIGQTEVTQELWQAVMGNNPSDFTDDLQRPVESVSWNDCQTFITNLNQMTGKNFRLPTEAEWEYAARGGSKSQGYKYAGSNTIDEVAWYVSNSGGKTHPVATKQPNELGLYDMSGNVLEWCQDWYGSYSSSVQTNPTGPATGSNRVFRGGSWYGGDWICRVSFRTCGKANYYDNDTGLRLAL